MARSICKDVWATGPGLRTQIMGRIQREVDPTTIINEADLRLIPKSSHMSGLTEESKFRHTGGREIYDKAYLWPHTFAAEMEVTIRQPTCERMYNIDRKTSSSNSHLEVGEERGMLTHRKIFIHSSMAIQPFFFGRGRFFFFSFVILYTVGKTPWTGDQPVARPLLTHRTTQNRE
jgi:hypothetical protein